ncbi:MAG: Gfo/Idh/MocA family protein [Halobacteriales archaeon]
MRENSVVPEVPYRPPKPDATPNIGLVGCGDITEHHLEAYTDAGWDVVAFCDIDRSAARKRREEYYPDADIYTDFHNLLARDDVGVVDIATPPDSRVPLIEDALRAETHVLSQKPFVLDLDVGERLIELAEDAGVKLAVNQNARWAPHYSWIRNAATEGRVGEIFGVHLDVHWNHDANRDAVWNDVRHALLYDYAIHHFDLVACLLDDRSPQRVHATLARSPAQHAKPPLLGQAIIDYPGAQASLVFDGNVKRGDADRIYVAGTQGTIRGEGPYKNQTVSLHVSGGSVSPDLSGSWFPDGFRGAMGELMMAIENDREPRNSGRNNLRSLELCYAAVAAAEDGGPKRPGETRELRRGAPSDLGSL